MVPMMKDSRNRESKTLTFVTAAFIPVWVKYILEGQNFLGMEFSHMSATEFGAAIAAILAIWLGREWTEKRKA